MGGAGGPEKRPDESTDRRGTSDPDNCHSHLSSRGKRHRWRGTWDTYCSAHHPGRVGVVHGIVCDIGIEVDLVLVADGIGLQEAA